MKPRTTDSQSSWQHSRRRFAFLRVFGKSAGLFLLAVLFAVNSWPQQPAKRPKIGVALQGGGAKGLAHIGVLQWFEEHHIPIDYLAGTSMGGLVGGLYATGHSPSDIHKIVSTGIDWGEVMSGVTPYQQLSYRRKQDLRAFPNGLEIGLKSGMQLPGGLNSGQSVRLIINRYTLPYSDSRSFDTLPTPFRCVATDLVSGKAVVFKDGSLPNALRATMSIPGVFAPVRDGEKVYADGGLLNNLPTDVVKDMGADIVIGVHLTTGEVKPQNVRSMLQVAGASNDAMIDANELRGMERSDLLITIDMAGYTTLDFSRVEAIIPKGYEAAQAKSTVLTRFSLNDDDWNRYVAERDSRRVKTMPVPQFVDVAGAKPELAKEIEQDLSGLAGEKIDITSLEDKITRMVGHGRFTSLSYGLTTRGGETGLLINAEEKDYSPPWLKPGFFVDGSDPNNVQFTFGSRLTFLDVGGYRSEIRLDFTVGSTYSFAGEYYHPFTPTSRWFIAPEVDASRSPLNLYVKNTFLAQYKLDSFGAGLDVGYGFDQYSEFRFGYHAGHLETSRWVGSPLLPSVSGRTGDTRATYAMDRLDNPVVPRRGTALVASAGWMDANPGGKNGFPTGEVAFLVFKPVSKPASIYLSAGGGSNFGYDNTGLPAFALGGPRRLAAYGINEFLTNQYIYGRAGYLRRVGNMPAILGTGVYLTAFGEFAKPYGLPNTGVPGDIGGGVIMDTILGPVLVGGAVGESGHQKWFFQLGRVF